MSMRFKSVAFVQWSESNKIHRRLMKFLKEWHQQAEQTIQLQTFMEKEKCDSENRTKVWRTIPRYQDWVLIKELTTWAEQDFRLGISVCLPFSLFLSRRVYSSSIIPAPLIDTECVEERKLVSWGLRSLDREELYSKSCIWGYTDHKSHLYLDLIWMTSCWD